jgi:hypothetical protein
VAHAYNPTLEVGMGGLWLEASETPISSNNLDMVGHTCSPTGET